MKSSHGEMLETQGKSSGNIRNKEIFCGKTKENMRQKLGAML